MSVRAASFARSARVAAVAGSLLVCCAQTKADDELPFVRSRVVDGVTSFETATRTYRQIDGSGPTVSLVGVVHIGDRDYYDALVKTLALSEIVLYESVLPRGAFGTNGSTDQQRQRRTQDAMLFLRGLLERYGRELDAMPSSLAALRAFVVSRDTRLARPFDLACVDGWKHALQFNGENDEFVLTSLGADCVRGGSKWDLDLVLEGRLTSTSDAPATKPPETKRDLYGELADALGVTLQVRSIDYDRVGWEPADLAMEDLLDRLWTRGERSMTIEMLSNDSGLAQGVVRFLLSMVSDSPAFKKMVVQALGTGGQRGKSALGAVDTRIIIDERNDAVIEQLAALFSAPTPPRSVAIFYGAAHMGDFEATLRSDFNLEAERVTWSRAMSVDEWDATKINDRLTRFREARSAILAADPQGAYPEVARIDGRIAALEARSLAAVTPPLK
jgi:hypothetical protein